MFELWQRNFLEQIKMNDSDLQPNCAAGLPEKVG